LVAGFEMRRLGDRPRAQHTDPQQPLFFHPAAPTPCCAIASASISTRRGITAIAPLTPATTAPAAQAKRPISLSSLSLDGTPHRTSWASKAAVKASPQPTVSTTATG